MERSGEPLQILFVEEDGTYRVDEEALCRVTSHERARGLPVAVLSVAGATRGGKSFLLDFFLRYLRASDEARRSGAWIGADDDPLTGFSWASGWEPNTNGILLWSEPIIGTRQVNGVAQQLAVILMDTQGTFDSNTSLRVSNTIFAMSTLMSSVQIYNLLQMINEDHLRHLQLFTELARMARSDEAGDTFQSLIFRVRDWEYPSRLPYGADGGERYLHEVFRVSALLRDQIAPCFERVSCVLTPHPGRVVTQDDFNGLRNVEAEFKEVLLEIVPLILDPSRLAPKLINRQEVTMEDLAVYFRRYIEVFNSEEVPPAETLFEAMSSASLETAENAARAAYRSHMERNCGGARYVARGSVGRAHSAAVAEARATFQARRKLAQPDVIAARLRALEQNLNAELPHYTHINNTKIATAVEESKAVYRRLMEEGSQTCLTPAELEQLQATALAAALAAAREGDEGEGDGDSDALTQDLCALLPLYRERNNTAVERVCSSARESFSAHMRTLSGAARCVHPNTLAAEYRRASAAAEALFDHAWRDQFSAINEHRNALHEHMEASYRQYESANQTINRQVLEEALQRYDSDMAQICGSERLCLHPLDLANEHSRACAAAGEYMLAARTATCRALPADSYIRNLNDKLNRRYTDLDERNERLNVKAVSRALTVFEDKLNPSRHDFFRIPSRGMHVGIYLRYDDVKRDALEFFELLRREGPKHDSDKHRDKLVKDIHEAYLWAKKIS